MILPAFGNRIVLLIGEDESFNLMGEWINHPERMEEILRKQQYQVYKATSLAELRVFAYEHRGREVAFFFVQPEFVASGGGHATIDRSANKEDLVSQQLDVFDLMGCISSMPDDDKKLFGTFLFVDNYNAELRRRSKALGCALMFVKGDVESFLLDLADVESYMDSTSARHFAEEKNRIDARTGLLTREGFQLPFVHALSEGRRVRDSLVLGFGDVDDFKKLNDEVGHSYGDEALGLIGQTIREVCSRRSVTVCRWAKGDEFLFVFENTILSQAKGRIRELERRVSELEVGPKNNRRRLGITCGATSIKWREIPDPCPHDLDIEKQPYFTRVDKIMYRRKKQKKVGR